MILNRNKPQKYDYLIFGISILSLFGLFLYFLNIALTPTSSDGKDFDPFTLYNTNFKIKIIYGIRSILWIAYLLTAIVWFKTKKLSSIINYSILILVCFIATLEWVELYYGSTFYYGEVRDKQGLGLPILSVILFSYAWTKLQIKKWQKMTLILMTILGTYLLFNLVKDDWHLFYEIYIPGTSIPIK